MKPNLNISRRTALGTIGSVGLGVVGAGAGLAAFSGSVAALTTNISTQPATVTTDSGNVSEVHINPSFNVDWKNFDDPIAKVRVLVEAKSKDGSSPPNTSDGYWPVFRATPWINGSSENGISESAQPTTTGYFHTNGPWANINLYNGTYGRPDYANLSYSWSGGVDEDSFLDGTSIGQPTGVPSLVNDGPNGNAGIYGAADDVSAFQNPKDGSTKTTAVDFRFVVSLHTNGTYSPLAMYNAPGTPGFDTSTTDAGSIPYRTLVSHKNHPAISVTEASFKVNAVNQPASQGFVANANSGASGNATSTGPKP